MKKINDRFVASATDIKKAQSHCNAMARKASFDGNIEAWLNQSNGMIIYVENIGNSYSEGNADMKLIAWAYTPERA